MVKPASGAFKILITDRFDVDALALLRSTDGIDISISASPMPTDAELAQTNALIIRSRTRVDTAFLERAPELKFIVTATSGFEHIDFSATQHLAVTHTPEANAASACELTWALILACARRLVEATRAVRSGDWRRETMIGAELSGQTLGVVGLGRIGSRVASVAQAFGMRVVAFDPYRDTFPSNDILRTSFEELLKLSDVVTFHVPATRETRHMLNLNAFESMNRSAIVVNTSRGQVISENDLVHALKEGWIAGCGLDVYEREPLPRDSRLLQPHSQVILTPHLGATTAAAFAAASREAALKVLAFVARGELRDPLPPAEPWYQSDFNTL